jgi:hypothetical protein
VQISRPAVEKFATYLASCHGSEGRACAHGIFFGVELGGIKRNYAGNQGLARTKSSESGVIVDGGGD